MGTQYNHNKSQHTFCNIRVGITLLTPVATCDKLKEDKGKQSPQHFDTRIGHHLQISNNTHMNKNEMLDKIEDSGVTDQTQILVACTDEGMNPNDTLAVLRTAELMASGVSRESAEDFIENFRKVPVRAA